VAATESELADVVSDLLGAPLDMTRPPWQFHLVDGPSGNSTVVVRMHHCIADGIALASVLLSLTDDTEQAVANFADAAGSSTNNESGGNAVLRRLGTGLRVGIGVIATGARVLTLPRDPRTCLHAPLGIRKGAAWTQPIELDRLKAIGRAYGVTVNDVALAVTAGALRSYLLPRGQAARDLRIFFPVNVRPPNKPVATVLGNRFGLIFLSLPISVADPDRRVRLVHERTRRLKAGQQAAATFVLLRAIGLAPRWAQRISARLLGTKSSAVITNVQGSSRPLTLAGAPLDSVVFWVPQTGSVGLGVSILSYAGKVTVGVAADRNVIGDPSDLADAMEAEVAELENRLR
jgi:WS/DGAT/MGAT family acyltransferase